MYDRYARSEALLERALRSIPLGSQTFSKSHTQYPRGVSPFFVMRGEGSHVWDVDGNEYVDFVSGLAALTLGYNDPEITEAVRQQLQCGTIFSLPHPIEMEAAEQLIRMVPCAEKVRFGKNGSDATAGAIRLARAYTGRERVAVCGYHGWQDWYIGTTSRRLGVPKGIQALSHTWNYNDLSSLEALLTSFPEELAAVIMEPMNVAEPMPGFLEGVRDLTERHGALLIFDETITGFRFARGGAQELFGVVPDLATFGKGMSNGYPLSAIVGRSEIMRLMEEIFFSFTFGGETLSLAAARSAMLKVEREPVVETLCRQGQKIIDGLRALIHDAGAEQLFAVTGHPSWSFLIINDHPSARRWELTTLFMQEMLARGILMIDTHNMSYRHDDDDIRRLLAAYAEVLPMMVNAAERGKLRTLLRAKPLEPLFKPRRSP